ncbi:GID complex subunit containing RING finger motif [Cryptotrichosporon argae]
MPPVPTGPLLLEEPLIRTPYELLRRANRSAQRQVEKDFTAVQSLIASLSKTSDPATALGKLDQAADRVKGLKRKLQDIQPAANKPSALRDRLAYYEQLEKGSSEHTLDRYIIDYLLRTDRKKAAKALAAEQGIESLVDIKLFTELLRIEEALVARQSAAEALAWCGENRGTLKKMGSDLEFHLRFQEFIELSRARKVADAIAYARKHLGQWAGAHMLAVQRGMALLAFGETTGVAAYRHTYDLARWADVAAQFRATFLSVYGLPCQSVLALALSAGLSSLRLPSCMTPAAADAAASHLPAPIVAGPALPTPLLPTSHVLRFIDNTMVISADYAPRDAETGADTAASEADAARRPPPPAALDPPVTHPDCPTCGPHMRELAAEVPLAHHTNSTIVCRISGRVMDSDNEPMAFPNGFVYSTKALAEMAKNNFDVVTCPRTHESCAFARLRKIYIS